MTLGAARVIWTINDLSTFVDQVTTGYVTYVIQAERGPMATPMVISSTNQYNQIFGLKQTWTHDPLVLEMCLRQGGQANVIRMAHYTDPADNTTCCAGTASVTLYDMGATSNVATITSEVGPFEITQKTGGIFVGTEAGPYTIVTGTSDKMSLIVGNGSGCTIDVTAALVGGAITAATIHTGGGGTGYKVGYILNISGGNNGSALVTTVGTGGVVTGISIFEDGSGYTSTTDTPATTDCMQTVTLPPGGLTTQAVVNSINAQTNGITASTVLMNDLNAGTSGGINLYTVMIQAVDISQPISLCAISHDAYTLLGFPTTATSNTPVVSTAVPGTDTFTITVDAQVTPQTVILTPIVGQYGTYYLSVGQVVERLTNGLEGVNVYASSDNRVIISTLDAGPTASLVCSSCTAIEPLGFDTNTHYGVEVGISQPTLQISALNGGSWGNDVSITITDSLLQTGLCFNVRVNYDRDGQMAEYYSDMTMDPSSDRYVVSYIKASSFLISAVDLQSTTQAPLNMPNVTPIVNGRVTGIYLYGGTDGIEASGGVIVGDGQAPFNVTTGDNDTLSITVGNVLTAHAQIVTLVGSNLTTNDVCLQINNSLTGATAFSYTDGYRNYIRIEANSLHDKLILNEVTYDAYTLLGMRPGIYPVNIGFCDADWIGEAQARTGIFAADLSYMSMDLMVPGTTSVNVYQAMTAYCANRGDMMAYGQCPAGNDPEDTIGWRMGSGSYTWPAFNNCRLSLWFGRPLVYDDSDNSQKYISCLGHLGSCLTKTDNMYGSWYAPVGPRRGAVTLCDGIDFNIADYRSTSYADLFAEYGINYLMISSLPGMQGAMFWEQRTTQTVTSATQSLNVMRFITVINRTLVPILRTFLFELNHPVTWRQIYRVLQPAFDQWKKVYAIYDYALQCDQEAFFDGGVLKNAVLNSGLNIDQGIYYCRALIQPTRAIYYLEFTLGVMATGVAFETYESMSVLPGWIRQ